MTQHPDDWAIDPIKLDVRCERFATFFSGLPAVTDIRKDEDRHPLLDSQVVPSVFSDGSPKRGKDWCPLTALEGPIHNPAGPPTLNGVYETYFLSDEAEADDPFPLGSPNGHGYAGKNYVTDGTSASHPVSLSGTVTVSETCYFYKSPASHTWRFRTEPGDILNVSTTPVPVHSPTTANPKFATDVCYIAGLATYYTLPFDAEVEVDSVTLDYTVRTTGGASGANWTMVECVPSSQ